MKYAIWIDAEKLHYLAEQFITFSIVERKEYGVKIEVTVKDAADVTNLIYAGVQYGIAAAFHNVKTA
jgi:hypothetical protein